MSTPGVRSFYATLGIELPAWSKRNASVPCFAQPDAHNRGDRSPSCSVNLDSGAWNCHGCGAHGGAYDAALAVGHTPRRAMELLVGHGLAPRAYRSMPEWAPVPGRVTKQAGSMAPPDTSAAISWDEADIAHCAETLDANSRLVRRLILERAWSPRTMRELELGFDGARITIPVRDASARLAGVLRYDPFGIRDPKMRAIAGTRLGLIPHPSREASERVILVEGPPDMIAARSAGLHAIAVPGTNAWHRQWAEHFAERHVTVVMDCDSAGRRAAVEIADSLQGTARTVDVVDMWPDRSDGYDLTDRILERRRSRSRPLAPCTAGTLLRPVTSRYQGRTGIRAREHREASR